VPTLPTKGKEAERDATTVWGVTHDLRSRVRTEEVSSKKISLVGYIVKTNSTPPRSARSTTRPAATIPRKLQVLDPRSPSPLRAKRRT
jgi:hypothetical protein